MNQLLANTLIGAGIASILFSIGALFTAVANYIGARTRLIEHSIQIAQLQKETTQIAAAQTASAASTQQPTIIAIPLTQAPAPMQSSNER